MGTLLLNVLVLPDTKYATIWNVAVKDDFKRKGIATKLMQEAEQIVLKDKDISRIWLFSGANRKDAHALYKKLGYDDKRDLGFIKIINGGSK